MAMRCAICILVLQAVSAYQVAPSALPMRGVAPAPLLTPVREQPARAVQPRMALEPSLLLSMELLGTEVNNGVVGVGAVVALAALAWSLRTSFAGGAAIILLLLGGDPEERVASGANENEVSTCAHCLCTPRPCALHSFVHLWTPVCTCRPCLCVPADPQEHCDGDHAVRVEEELPGRGPGRGRAAQGAARPAGVDGRRGARVGGAGGRGQRQEHAPRAHRGAGSRAGRHVLHEPQARRAGGRAAAAADSRLRLEPARVPLHHLRAARGGAPRYAAARRASSCAVLELDPRPTPTPTLT